MTYNGLYFFSVKEGAVKLSNLNRAKYKQSAWTLSLLNPSTGFYFSTPMSKKGNLRYLQASENTNRARPKDWVVHQQYVLFSLCETEDISITFWPSQADAINASPGAVSARQPGEAEWTPKTELQGWAWGPHAVLIPGQYL